MVLNAIPWHSSEVHNPNIDILKRKKSCALLTRKRKMLHVGNLEYHSTLFLRGLSILRIRNAMQNVVFVYSIWKEKNCSFFPICYFFLAEEIPSIWWITSAYVWRSQQILTSKFEKKATNATILVFNKWWWCLT